MCSDDVMVVCLTADESFPPGNAQGLLRALMECYAAGKRRGSVLIGRRSKDAATGCLRRERYDRAIRGLLRIWLEIETVFQK